MTWRVLLLTVWLAAVAAPAAVDGSEPPRFVVQLEELWRAGGEDDGIILGAPVAARPGGDGRVLVLDHQLCQVLVFGPDGSLERTLSRRGEGPGEVTMPVDLARLPDGSWGLAEFFPARIVRLTAGGDPAGEIRLQRRDSAAFTLLTALDTGGGNTLVGGFSQSPDPVRLARVDFLLAMALDGREKVCYHQRAIFLDPTAGVTREADYLPPFLLSCAVGPDGRVYFPQERDRYAVAVHSPEGTLERVLTRNLPPRPREAEATNRIAALFAAWSAGQDPQPRLEIEANEPMITALQVDAAGRLWVQHAYSGVDQAPGVFLSLDIFDGQGGRLGEASLVCPGDPVLDGLVLLDEGRVLVIRNYVLSRLQRLAAIAAVAPTFGEAGEQRPCEVICYRLPDLIFP